MSFWPNSRTSQCPPPRGLPPPGDVAVPGRSGFRELPHVVPAKTGKPPSVYTMGPSSKGGGGGGGETSLVRRQLTSSPAWPYMGLWKDCLMATEAAGGGCGGGETILTLASSSASAATFSKRTKGGVSCFSAGLRWKGETKANKCLSKKKGRRNNKKEKL